jgi:hypothetical protein
LFPCDTLVDGTGCAPTNDIPGGGDVSPKAYAHGDSIVLSP